MREHTDKAGRDIHAITTAAVMTVGLVALCANYPGYGGERVIEWIEAGLKQQVMKNLRRVARRFSVPLSSKMNKEQVVNAMLNGRWGYNLKAPMLELGSDPSGGPRRVGYPGLAAAFAAMTQSGRDAWLRTMNRAPAGSMERSIAARLQPWRGQKARPDIDDLNDALGLSDIGHPNGSPGDLKRLAEAGCLNPDGPKLKANATRLSAYDYMTPAELKKHRLSTNEAGQPISRRHFNAAKIPVFNPATCRFKTRRDGSLKMVRVELRVGHLDSSEPTKWQGRFKDGSSNRRTPCNLRRVILDTQSGLWLTWVAIAQSHLELMPALALPNPPSKDAVESALESINRASTKANQMRGELAPGFKATMPGYEPDPAAVI